MDDFLKKAGNLLGDIAGKAGREAEVLQLQAKLGSLDDERDQQYIEAGKRARELLTMRQIHDDELRVILQRVKDIEDRMMELREQVQQLRQDAETGATEDGGPGPAE